jgi:hypothetical protein
MKINISALEGMIDDKVCNTYMYMYFYVHMYMYISTYVHIYLHVFIYLRKNLGILK